MGQLTVSSRLATVGLVILATATVVLVAVAMRSSDTSGVARSPVSSAGTSSTPSDTGSDTSSPTAPATAATAAAALAAPLRTIVRVRPTDGQTAFVIGADTPCAAELSTTSDGGRTWEPSKDVGSAWFRDPKNPNVVGGPGSSTSRPCDRREVLDLAVLSTSTTHVLCSDGVIRSTANTGSTWTASGNASGAVALAVLSSKPAQISVARVNAPDCAGVQIWRVDRRAAPSCITTSLPENPGQISLSLFDGGGWLAVGDTTRRSTDGLVTWSASSKP